MAKKRSTRRQKRSKSLGALHPYGMDTEGVLKWHGEALERELHAGRCSNATVSGLTVVKSEISQAFHERRLTGVEAARMENQLTRLFNKKCVVKPRR